MANLHYAKFHVDTKTKDYITLEEYIQIRTWLLTHWENRQRNALLVHLLWYTGGRVSSVLRLKPGDINRRQMIIRMYNDKVDQYYDIPLPAELDLEIMNYVQLHGIDKEHVIIDLTRQQANNILAKAGQEAIDRHIHAHMFRHGAAMRLLKEHADWTVIQRWLDHSSPAVTFNTYAKVTVEMMREAAERSGLQ